jgi:hypothetical protein
MRSSASGSLRIGAKYLNESSLSSQFSHSFLINFAHLGDPRNQHKKRIPRVGSARCGPQFPRVYISGGEDIQNPVDGARLMFSSKRERCFVSLRRFRSLPKDSYEFGKVGDTSPNFW